METYGEIFNGAIPESDHMRATFNDRQTEADRNNHVKQSLCVCLCVCVAYGDKRHV